MNWFSLIALTTLSSIFLMGCNWILHGEHTEFAGGYSERKFQQIKQGMPMQTVVSLLGPPLSQSTQQWSDVWSYRPPGMQPSVTRTKDGTMIFSNYFGKITNLRFTPAGTVIAVTGDYLNGNFVGLTKEQVRAKLGEPNSRTLQEFQIVYRYTAPGKRGTGTYKRREVRFDVHGAVIRTLVEMYYD